MTCSYVPSIGSVETLAVLVRHAERPKLTNIANRAEVLLTETGIRDARAFGRSLSKRFKRIKLWHSPVSRCGQTAQQIAEGVSVDSYEVSVEGSLSWLGEELIAADQEWMNAELVQLRYGMFLRNWFDGKYKTELIRPLGEVAQIELSHVFQQMDEAESAVVVDVTHDWNIILLREHFLGIRYEDVGGPPYLDAIAFFCRGGHTFAWYQGKTARMKRGFDVSL